MIFNLIRLMALAPIHAAQAAPLIGQRLIGWWIGVRRGWTPDTRSYGARRGYVVRYTDRRYWWDGERLTPIIEK